MNEHIRKGNEAFYAGDFVVAEIEFQQALKDPDDRWMAQKKLGELPKTKRKCTPEQARLWRPSEFKETVIPTTVSRCCRAKALLVRSRAGNFVSLNCTWCLKPDYAREEDLPKRSCCGQSCEIIRSGKNYAYKCKSCGTVKEVGDLLPHWDEHFPYSPLVAPGDLGYRR